MKTVDKAEVKTIHPDVLNDMTMEASIALLEVARDMRSGVIGADEFYMGRFHDNNYSCGTTHCICGWMEVKLDQDRSEFIKLNKNHLHTKYYGSRGLHDGWPARLVALFRAENPSNPLKAADAIENYLFNYAKSPWSK